MYLLTLVILSLALGYLLATEGSWRGLKGTTRKLRHTPARWSEQVEERWKALFSHMGRTDAFQCWVLDGGASLFPADFRAWVAGLSDDEARRFSLAVGEYANSLGFSLRKLIEGEYDRDPMLRQVFVETVVVYSPAYRKARQAQEQAREAAQKAAEQPVAHNGAAQPAEKVASRRKNNGAQEIQETAAAD
jgi:hypothetical protein